MEGNRGKRAWNHPEPLPPEGTPDCPEHLNEEARAEWHRLVDTLVSMAKARGVKLGNPNGAASLRRAGKGGVALRAAVSANAAGFAADLAPVLADIRAAGHTSLRAIAEELTARGIRTRRGGEWGVGNVKRLLAARGDILLGVKHYP